jgi:1-deoxy-D-xylulose-5-phosphate reductoisomerase
VVHPQSIVHSLVRYRDGSLLAQLGEPDMRTPIACCLGWPERIDAGVRQLDMLAVGRLDFEPPDMEAFRCLRIARDCIAAGGNAMAICNAANEIAVAAFLDEIIGFQDIPAVIEETLAALPSSEPRSLDDVQAVDTEARVRAQACVSKRQRKTGAVRS